jgi:hypothetical protein
MGKNAPGRALTPGGNRRLSMARGSRSRGEGAFGMVVGTVLVIVVAIALFKIVPLHIHASEIYDVMNEQANFGSMKDYDKIRYEIFRKGENVLPPNALPMSEIKVLKKGDSIWIGAKYKEEVEVFGYKYVYNFDKTVEKPTF